MLLAVLATLGLATLPPATAPAAAATPEPTLASHSMLYLNTSAAYQRKMFEAAQASGASQIRVDVSMVLIDTWLGMDWTSFDRVRALAREFHMPLVGMVYAAVLPNADCAPGTRQEDTYRCPPKDLEAWSDFVGVIAARGRAEFSAIEVLNEPDGTWAFTGTPERYGQMLVAAADAVHAAAPGLPVAMGGLMEPSSAGWMDRALAIPGAAQAIDIRNIHIRGSMASAKAQVRFWQGYFDRYGIDDRLWVTEFGYPSDTAYQTDDAYKGGEEAQARFLKDAIPMLAHEGVELTFVSLRDNMDGQFASEGIVAGQGVADPPAADPVVRYKPAVAALASTQPARPAPDPANAHASTPLAGPIPSTRPRPVDPIVPAPVPTTPEAVVPPVVPATLLPDPSVAEGPEPDAGAEAPVGAVDAPLVPPSLSVPSGRVRIARVGTSRRLAVIRSQGLKLTIRCPAGCAPTVRAGLSVASARAAGVPSALARTASAGRATSHRLTLKLPKDVARRLARRGRAVTLLVTVTGAGAPRTLRVPLSAAR